MKRILITGVSRGIGHEFALQYARAGHTVYGIARSLSNLQGLRDEGVQLIPGDVTDPGLDEILKHSLTGVDIDICINNAGVFPNRDRIDIIPESDAMRLAFEVNVLGPLNVVKAVEKYMVKAGKFVMLSTSMASIAGSGGGGISYSVSKTALNMLTKKLQHSYSDYVFLLLHPGWVKTDMGGQGASLEIPYAVSSMIETIDDADSFAYLDYKGELIPW
jgi:NAD(P)-dependent dehydrogenase (short-subunit alcohol dehydrogenase family)